MKGFKRFGGEFSGGGDSGNFWVGALGLALLVVCCVAALVLARPGLVVVGFAIFFGCTLLSTLFGGSTLGGLLKERRREHLAREESCFELGDFSGSVDALERAKQYGPLSERYRTLYSEAVRLARH